MVLNAIASGKKMRRKISSEVRSKATRKALTLIRDLSEEPLTVQSICGAIGVSERTLQYAFQEQLGVTPKQYLQSVRLGGVRRDLRRLGSCVKIADVANRWGFWHLGQFAADYHRQFGERPSQTQSRD